MKFQVSSSNVLQQSSDCLVVFVGSKKTDPFQLLPKGKALDQKFSTFISTIALKQDFEGNVGKTLLFHIGKENNASHILIAGVGDVKKLTMKDFLDAMATIGKKAKKMHAYDVAIVLEDDLVDRFGAEKVGEGIVEGMTLGTYTFNRYKKQEKKEHVIKSVTVFSTNEKTGIEKGMWFGERVSEATIVARDLVNEPSSVTTPTFLALVAQDIAKNNASIACEVLEKKDMEKLGMGGILGIAKGSDEEPKLIVLKYQKGQTHHSRNSDFFNSGNEKTIVLVGKGVTFDSGGLSLKRDANMETMKLDMAGAAAILGIFSVISECKPEMNIIGLIPAVENMPSGKAIKPGDIVTAYNGETIEIISTDAEGRVILADALSYAQKFNPHVIIDLATLTGACSIALGEEIAGLFVNEKTLADQLLMLGKETGERLWELPLAKEYEELLKSSVADIKNVAKTRAGGAITGALFLKPFVPENVQWAHIDIGGTAWQEKDSALCPEGGTGFGVRLILEYLETR